MTSTDGFVGWSSADSIMFAMQKVVQTSPVQDHLQALEINGRTRRHAGSRLAFPLVLPRLQLSQG